MYEDQGRSTASRILVVNVGSSSCKLSVVVDGTATQVADGDGSALTWSAARWRTFARQHWSGAEPEVILHRFVHGGGLFHEPTVVDRAVRERLSSLISLAPLHTAKALAVLDLLVTTFPRATAIACFDTTFHQTLAPRAYTYAVPLAWREDHGLRKYGFHGFAHDYANRRALELLGRRDTPRRVVSCHLGSGASLAAIVGGESVDTTMGFTPVDGLVMATRPGSLDPGSLLWLLNNSALTRHQMSEALENDSGLTAFVGHGDMTAVQSAASDGDKDATLAYEVWLHRLVGQLGNMIAVIGGVDVIVFGGGIGENSPEIRAAAASALSFLGVELDEQANRAAHGDAVISSPRSSVACVVVDAREDLAMIRRATEAGLAR